MNGSPVKRGNSVYNPRAPLPTRLDSGALRDPMSSWYQADPNQKPRAQAPSLVDAFGRVVPPTDDPGFQPPGAVQPSVSPSVIYRQIPNISTQTGYAPANPNPTVAAIPASESVPAAPYTREIP